MNNDFDFDKINLYRFNQEKFEKLISKNLGYDEVDLEFNYDVKRHINFSSPLTKSVIEITIFDNWEYESVEKLNEFIKELKEVINELSETINFIVGVKDDVFYYYNEINVNNIAYINLFLEISGEVDLL